MSGESGKDLVATVWRDRQRWSLSPGASLLFGRSSASDVRVGHAPLDDFVSRRAGTLTALPDAVLIRNESTSQVLLFRPVAGPQRTIEPQTGMAAFTVDFFRVVVPGRHGREYPISVSVPALRSTVDHAAEDDEDTGVTRRSQDVSARERRLLAALCEPLLTRTGGEAVHASYRDIAARLGLAPKGVRGAVDALRFRLGTEGGVPGLVAPAGEPAAPEGAKYIAALADWAVRSRTVTLQIIEELLPPED